MEIIQKIELSNRRLGKPVDLRVKRRLSHNALCGNRAWNDFWQLSGSKRLEVELAPAPI